MFGRAGRGRPRRVDSVESGVIPRDKADDYVMMVGVFIHGMRATTRRFTTTTIRRRESISALWPKPSVQDVISRLENGQASLARNNRVGGPTLWAEP